jgi:hypothetical protein
MYSRSLLIPCLLLMSPIARADVVINELISNPAGTDTGSEWIELFNNGLLDEDISGWKVQRATSSWTASTVERYTIPSGTTLEAGRYLVIGDSGVTEADLTLPAEDSLALGNASSSADAVRLVDSAGAVMDTVVYGEENPDDLEDDNGWSAISLAPVAGSGESIGRLPNGYDTDYGWWDFWVIESPNPGLPNDYVPCDIDIEVVINEFMADPSGPDEDDEGNKLEWVELMLVDGGSANLSGWRIAAGTSSFSTSGALPEGTILDGSGYLVVGNSAEVDFVDVVVEGFTLGNAGSNADGVRLEDCTGYPVDTVIYGEANEDGWVDDSGFVTGHLAPEPIEGLPLGRLEDGQDSDQSDLDFDVLNYSTPGASNSSPAQTCGGPESGVVINEFFANPEGSDDGLEWLELYHAGDEVLDLTDWAIQVATSSFQTKVTFAEDTFIDPGEFLVIGGELVGFADLTSDSFTLPNGTGGDGLRLVDCYGFPADTVVYGSSNSDEIVDDLGEVAVSLAPKPGDAESIARIQDGYDTDECGVDFLGTVELTPGAPNPVHEPVVCVPSDGSVVLNEFLSDPSGDDGGFEWVELYNRSSSEVSIAGWAIAAGTQDYEDLDIIFSGGIIIPAGGWWVVGGEGVEEADFVAAFTLGNGSGGDGLRLVDCDGKAVDTVVYGTSNEDELEDDNGVYPSVVAAPPDDDQSLARKEDGTDSNDPGDWFIDMTPTPGGSNYQEPVVVPKEGGCGRKAPGSGEQPGGCGANRAENSEVEQGGCATFPLPLGGAELLLAMTAVLRRRRRF